MTAVILIYLAKNMVISFIDNYKSHMEAGILNIYFHGLSGIFVLKFSTIKGASKENTKKSAYNIKKKKNTKIKKKTYF